MTRHTSGEPTDPRDGRRARRVEEAAPFEGHVQPPDSSAGPMSVTLLGGRAVPADRRARPSSAPPPPSWPPAPPVPAIPPPGGPESITWLDHPSGPLPAAPPLDPADISAVVDSVVRGLAHDVGRPSGSIAGPEASMIGADQGTVTGAWDAGLPGPADPLASTGPYAYPPPSLPAGVGTPGMPTPPEPTRYGEPTWYAESTPYGDPPRYTGPVPTTGYTQLTGPGQYPGSGQYTGTGQYLVPGQYVGPAARPEHGYDPDGRGYPAPPGDAGPTAAALAQIARVEPVDPVVSAAASGMASSAAPIPYATEEAAPMVYAPRGRSYPQGLRRRRGRRAPGAQRIVSVDNNRCHLYAICQMEAPATFELGRDGRLRYDMAPPGELLGEVRQAARLCPMQAIKIRED